MTADGLEVRQSSASVWGSKTELRNLKVVSKLIDTSTCIGCKACEVACQEWNDLHIVPTEQRGTYQTMPSLDPNYWNLIQFREREIGPDFAWLLRKDGCMHCADPGCLKACPAPGAIVQYQNGIVDVNPEACIGCRMCETGCPFDIPRYSEQTSKMAKCTLCVDRVQVGLEPACVKSCPTGCLEFGDKTDLVAHANARVEQLKQNGFVNAATGGISIPTASTLKGTGALTGTVTNAGTITPGNSPGILHITGNFVQTSTGNLSIAWDTFVWSVPITVK